MKNADALYWHLALQALPVEAFLAHVSYAVASFFGLAPVGSDAASRHAPAPLSEPQLWNASSVDWQSLFFPHAAACFAHVLSMHLPQSLSLIAGGGGVAGALLSAAGALPVSLDAPDDAGAALDDSAAPEAPGSGAEASPLVASSAGVSGGFEPPQAAQTRGTAVTRRRLARRERGRLMGS